MKKFFTVILLLVTFCSVQSIHSSVIDTSKVYGVTIDGINKISNTVTSLSKHYYKPTTRIVFDEWIPAAEYTNAVNRISNVSFIMGELLDSYYMKQYNLSQYVSRTNEYLNILGNKVDIWEIGNEINGEWLGTTASVVAKMDTAYKIVKAANKKTALTLYYNKVCYEKARNEMFRWAVTNIPQYMKEGLDYVWISYYEDDCNNYQPNWQVVFDSLGKIFPNSKIGIGECGTTNTNKKAEYIKRYYTMKIKHERYVGGYFWWYYRQDCTPYTKALWSTLDTSMCGLFHSIGTPEGNRNIKLGNYPNPFNPSTKINYYIPAGQKVSLKVYDAAGREVAMLVNEWKAEGNYTIDYKPSGITSGVYFYKLVTEDQTVVNRMILLK